MPEKHSVFGDSISTFEGIVPEGNIWFYDEADTNGTGVVDAKDTWWMRAIEREGGKLLANASFSGSMVQGAGFPAGQSPERARQILGTDGSSPDVVWVFIGANDYGWGSPEAQVVGGSQAAPACACAEDFPDVDPAGPAPADAIERFEAAYAQMLENIRAVAPDAEVRCLTLPPGRALGCDASAYCWSLRGVPLGAYNDAIRRAAARAGARIVDIGGLGYDYDAIDGTHPNKEGMRQLAQLVAAAQGDASALQGYPARLASTCACEHPGALCPRADITASRWSCVVA